MGNFVCSSSRSHPRGLHTFIWVGSVNAHLFWSPSCLLPLQASVHHLKIARITSSWGFCGHLSKNCGTNLTSTEGRLDRYWETLDRDSEVICSLRGTLLNSKGIIWSTHFHRIPDHTSFRGNFQREDYFLKISFIFFGKVVILNIWPGWQILSNYAFWWVVKQNVSFFLILVLADSISVSGLPAFGQRESRWRSIISVYDYPHPAGQQTYFCYNN